MIEYIEAEDIVLQTDTLKIINVDGITLPVDLIRSASAPSSLDHPCGSIYLEITGSSSNLYLKQDNGVSSNFTPFMKGFTIYGDTGSLVIGEGGNVSIVGTGGTSTAIVGTVLTISAGASNLSDLLDISFPSPGPQDQDILRYDGGSGYWMADQELFVRTDQGSGVYTLDPFDSGTYGGLTPHAGSHLLIPNFIELRDYAATVFPATSFAGHIRIFSSIQNAIPQLSSINSGGGVVRYTGETLFQQRSMQILVDPASTTVSSLGIVPPTLDGVLSNVDNTTGPWLKHTTATTPLAAAGPISAAFNYVQKGWEPKFIATILTPTIYSSLGQSVVWAGFTAVNIDAFTDPVQYVAAFLYSGGSNWFAYTNDKSGTGTSTDTGITFSANTAYILRVECFTNSIEFYIDDVLVATNTTDLPADSRTFGWCIRVIHVPNGGAADDISWGRVAILHK